MTTVIPKIAIHVFRDSVRDRVLYTLVVFAVLMIGASLLIGQLTAGHNVKIIKDPGLAASSVFCLLIAVFIGVSLVAKEVDRWSLYTVLAKPLSRHDVILGKYAWLVLTLTINLTVMAATHYAILVYLSATEEFKRGWEAPAIDPALLKAYFLILMELMLVTAIALLFSTFSSQIFSASSTFGLYVVGHLNGDLRSFEDVVGANADAAVAKGLSYLLPNLEPFSVSPDVVHGQPVSFEYIALTTGYALTYVAILLVGSMFIFSRRDFT